MKRMYHIARGFVLLLGLAILAVMAWVGFQAMMLAAPQVYGPNGFVPLAAWLVAAGLLLFGLPFGMAYILIADILAGRRNFRQVLCHAVHGHAS